jgi:hypothetical protein
MPLYTYVVSFRDETYVVQARRSNSSGFGDWFSGLPAAALTPAERKELTAGQLYGVFDEIPNSVHAWRKRLTIGGSQMIVTAIQTVG